MTWRDPVEPPEPDRLTAWIGVVCGVFIAVVIFWALGK